MRFTKPTRVVGLDIGSHSVKAVHMSKSGNKLRIEDVGYALVDRNQVNVDPVAAHANALRDAIEDMPARQSLIVGALPGQTVVIRYPRLKNMPEAQMDEAIEREAGQNIPYDLSEVFLDWSLLEREGEGDDAQLKVLLVAAKHEVIDSRVQIADAAEIDYGVLSVDSLALADAAQGCEFTREGETVALINIGASSASIHFTRDGISNFIRDVSWGARELIQAISKSRRCDYEEAERTLQNIEAELANESNARAIEPEPFIAALPDDEPASPASLLDPLEEEFAVEGNAVIETPLDDSDISGISAVGVEAPVPLREVLAQPLSRLVSEVRRSFDYYEHQLYERPVDRILLSGGIAHLDVLRDTLRDDLNIEAVELANPSAGAIPVANHILPKFQEHPAQFMVAVGLAARGAAQL